MSVKMDMKKFVKVSADDKHTIMQHADGHQIKIAHAALSPKMRAELHAIPCETKMADGGQVADKGPKLDPEKARQFSKGASESGWQPQKWVQNVKQALTPPEADSSAKMADGGDVQPANDADPKASAPDETQPAAPQAPVTINIGAPGGGMPQLPANTINPNPGAQAAAQNPQPQQAPPDAGSQPYGVDPEQSAAASMPKAAQPTTQDAQPSATPTPGLQSGLQSGTGATSDPYGTQAYGNALAQGINEQKAGLRGEALAEGSLGQAQAQLLQQQAQTQQKVYSDYQTHYNQLDQERQNFQQDILNKHIDPSHYINSLGTEGKISTAIGLVLGGLGAGMLHSTDNQALKFVNMQIDRDIASQQADLGKKESLLSANMRQFGNLKDATDMTRVMQSDIVSNQLKEAAANAQDPIAKSRALQAAGKLDQDAAPILSQIAMRKTMMNGGLAGGTPDSPQMGQTIQAMRQMNPTMAKSLEERYVPTVGMATVPVPQAGRDTIIAKQQLQNMSTDFYNWAKDHSGSVDPTTVNEGKTKAAELQSLYRNSINGGVFKKGEQEFIDNIVDSDPTKFFNSVRVLPKLEEVMRSNQQQLNTLKRGYGLPGTTIQESAPIIQK